MIETIILATLRGFVRRLSQLVSCGETLMPSSRRVNLVNMAGGTNPETHVFVDNIKDRLIITGIKVYRT